MRSWILRRLDRRILSKDMRTPEAAEESPGWRFLSIRADVRSIQVHVFFPKLIFPTAWRLADIQYAEDKYRDFEGELFGGKVDMAWRETSFCWCFWSLSIPITDLKASDAILVRGMDEALSLQPRDMYWSVLGMMNNPWFRVTITKDKETLLFEHPTHPVMAGGWMERIKKAGGDLTNGNWGERVEGETAVEPEPLKEINMKKTGLNRIISLDEFTNHNERGEHWFVVNGEVYDGKPFLEGHPGGAQSIISSVGLDVSEDFNEIREFNSVMYQNRGKADVCYR